LLCTSAYLAWRFESGGWRKIDIFNRRKARPAVDASIAVEA
jgi:hypothetical protein